MAKATAAKSKEIQNVASKDTGIVNNDSNIIDIDLSVTEKKRFRINGDPNKILELNISDLTITTRLADAYAKLDKLTKNAQQMAMIHVDPESSDEEQMKAIADFGEKLKSIDQEMRSILDDLFDAPVSKICAPYGSLFDVFEGQFRYEHIIDKLSQLYHNNFNEEFKRTKMRLQQKTQKYTNSRKR